MSLNDQDDGFAFSFAMFTTTVRVLGLLTFLAIATHALENVQCGFKLCEKHFKDFQPTQSRGLSQAEKNRAVDLHNLYRDEVAGGRFYGYPRASNMRKLVRLPTQVQGTSGELPKPLSLAELGRRPSQERAEAGWRLRLLGTQISRRKERTRRTELGCSKLACCMLHWVRPRHTARWLISIAQVKTIPTFLSFWMRAQIDFEGAFPQLRYLRFLMPPR